MKICVFCILFIVVVALQIKVKNFSKEQCILVNGEEVDKKRVLNSGDIISLMGSKMRWESKAEARRKLKFICITKKFKWFFLLNSGLTQLMSRSERKAKAGKILKTKKRITIHKYVKEFLLSGSLEVIFFVSESI
jgi:23S rRNA-/tRNA-specific pseudouridylate synthase